MDEYPRSKSRFASGTMSATLYIDVGDDASAGSGTVYIRNVHQVGNEVKTAPFKIKTRLSADTRCLTTIQSCENIKWV